MTRWRRPWAWRIASLVVLVGLVASACVSEAAGPREASRPSRPRSVHGEATPEAQPSSQKGMDAESDSPSTDGGRSATSQDAVASPDTGGESSQQSGDELERASVVIREPNPDRTGAAASPSYAELVEASLVGLGTHLRLKLVFAAPLPERISDPGKILIAGFGLERKEQNLSLFARGDRRGWRAFISGGKGDQRFRGKWSVSGSSIEFLLPWQRLGGAQPLEWAAVCTLIEAATGAPVQRSTDSIPNERSGRYPSRGER